jgi:hypothetical protein
VTKQGNKPTFVFYSEVLDAIGHHASSQQKPEAHVVVKENIEQAAVFERVELRILRREVKRQS